VLARHVEPTEPGIARGFMAALPDGARVVVSSSMPVRDLEWFTAARSGVQVFSNRGANGIDGVVSTAVGVALADATRPVALLIGDIALLHDANGLLGLTDRPVNLTLVVVDNAGGGIFSFLPQASAYPTDRFELLFGTPHRVDLAALAAVHGIESCTPTTAAEVVPAVARAASMPGVQLVHVRTERQANVAVHAELNQAVLLALDAMRA
jgi:2-succinyl-5-enolpyruvyl-6-hydroxy-3-cyclohexene-1-carboxylate synthase